MSVLGKGQQEHIECCSLARTGSFYVRMASARYPQASCCLGLGEPVSAGLSFGVVML